MQPEQIVREYLAPFAGDFPRRDQFRWAALYVSGLLADLPRKNIETIARHLAAEHGEVGQALQNFIQRSPWDEQVVGKRYRAQVLDRLADPEGMLVFQEVTFIKQGQHSVGVQRQFSHALGDKVNCQLAVGVYYVGRKGLAPLYLQLYLPGDWVKDPGRLVATGVPPAYRQSVTKAELALRILDELVAENIAPPHLVGRDFAQGPSWREELGRRGYALSEDGSTFSRKPLPAMPHLQHGAASVARGWDSLRELGLDHFEGRSWRGFHHHVCLVMLAAEATR